MRRRRRPSASSKAYQLAAPAPAVRISSRAPSSASAQTHRKTEETTCRLATGGRYRGSTSNAIRPTSKRPAATGKETHGAEGGAVPAFCRRSGFCGSGARARSRCAAAFFTSVLACAALCAMCLPLFQPRTRPQRYPSRSRPWPPPAPRRMIPPPRLKTSRSCSPSRRPRRPARRRETQQPQLTDEQIYNTIVYSVFNNAENYHTRSRVAFSTTRRTTIPAPPAKGRKTAVVSPCGRRSTSR